MKLFILLLVTSLQVSAVAFAQNISINVKNARLDDVLNDICNQSKLSYSINPADIGLAKPVTIILKNQPIEKILQTIFSDQPFTYSIQNKIVLVRRKETERTSITETQKRADVSGRVTTESGDPLPGATVKVKGTNIGAVTGADGSFTVTGAPDNGTLIITMIGRETREVSYREGSAGSIALSEVDQELKEIVIAYGKVKEKYSTSNVAMISGDVISRQPVSNPLIAIQGRLPGLFIKQATGVSTGMVNVTVQGRNSISNGNQPFYVIDGVPFTPNSLVTTANSSVGGSIAIGATSNLNYVNPEEIESITVLKDADATAIYGSRAANGAILITTKRGKAGQTRANLNVQTGWGKQAKLLDVLSLDEYVTIRKEALANANQQISPSDIDINGGWDLTRDVNWLDELVNNTAQFQNIQASLSGGNERIQFLAGVAYIRNTPTIAGNFSNVKTSVNFNINHASNNQKFKFFLSGSYLEGTNRLPKEDITDVASTLAPNFPDLYNPDGTINWSPVPGVFPDQATYSQPAAILQQRYTNRTNNLIANSDLSYEIIPGLVVKSTFGYNRLQTNETGIMPITSFPPEFTKYYNIKGMADYSFKNGKSWIVEPQATYTKSFGNSNFDVLLGSTFQRTDNNVLQLHGEQYNTDLQLEDFTAAGLKSTSGTLQSRYNYSAVFGRINYRLMDRYILNLAARRDGSSRFGSNNIFQNFYSIGGAWLFSEETIFKKILPFINYGKLRSSYGITGNDQIGDYNFYSLYNVYNVAIPYLGVTGITPRGLGNPNLQWEETRKFNLGLDIGFLNSTVILNANYFRNRSSNQLLSENLSQVTGFTSRRMNLPATIQNTGWEFNVEYKPFRGDGFNWQGSANLTIPKNKLVRYDGLEKLNDRNRYVIGESINISKLYSFQGVNSQTGLYQFNNAKGELTSVPDPNADKYVIRSNDPKYYGGLSNTLSYKRFSLDIFFQFVNQMGVNGRFSKLPGINFNSNTIREYTLNRWRKPGDNAPVQMISKDYAVVGDAWRATSESDGSWSDLSYIRLNNASLSYSLNPIFLKKAHISTARLYVQGQNLFTVSPFKAADPELIDIGVIGLLRTYTVGVQMSF